MQRFSTFLFFFLLIIRGGCCESEYSNLVETNELKTSYQYNAFKQCTALFREYKNQIVMRCFYFYDSQGFLEKTVIDDGIEREADDLTGVTYQQITHLQIGDQFPLIGKPLKIENTILDFQSSNEEFIYEIFFHYNREGELISAIDSQGVVVIEEGVSAGDDPSKNHMYYQNPMVEMIFIDQVWNFITESFLSCFQYMQSSALQAKISLNSELKLPDSCTEALESFFKTLVGKHTYMLMGPHFEETRVDSYGQHEMNDKVRVTFINGILNTNKMIEGSLKDISESHGGVKVHYVFRPTEGWVWDVSHAAAIKTAFSFGFRSYHAHLLAQLWRDLIQEMGGVNQGGVIVHYAHSLGGSDTDRARSLLTPEEQKMIRVFTFGSATMVRNEGFQSVINIVSVYDGVSSPLLEPFGHLRNYFDPESNIRFYPCFDKTTWPLCDHAFDGLTYSAILSELGVNFLNEFWP